VLNPDLSQGQKGPEDQVVGGTVETLVVEQDLVKEDHLQVAPVESEEDEQLEDKL